LQEGNRIVEHTDKAIVRMATSHQAVAQANERWPRKNEVPEAAIDEALAREVVEGDFVVERGVDELERLTGMT
jgi:hypothetical protein